MKAVAGEMEDKRVSLATVKLEILDTNDNSPIFLEEVCKILVPLNFFWAVVT